ncbi:hypothetical protein CB1_001437017 [Camelus ferus]|nr:hypothetical protein CB1_001437017 [Camelus ferus]
MAVCGVPGGVTCTPHLRLPPPTGGQPVNEPCPVLSVPRVRHPGDISTAATSEGLFSKSPGCAVRDCETRTVHWSACVRQLCLLCRHLFELFRLWTDMDEVNTLPQRTREALEYSRARPGAKVACVAGRALRPHPDEPRASSPRRSHTVLLGERRRHPTRTWLRLARGFEDLVRAALPEQRLCCFRKGQLPTNWSSALPGGQLPPSLTGRTEGTAAPRAVTAAPGLPHANDGTP